MPHPCTTFWNPAATPWANELSALLSLIARADALRMSEATYSTLSAVQQDIERATNYPPTPIPDRILGVPSPWSDEDEALLRATAQAFLNGLNADQFDGSAGAHTPLVLGWMLTGVPKPGGLSLLRGSATPPAGGVLGKVRNALGS